MIAAGYLLHKPDALIILGTYGVALFCGYQCGRYDKRQKQRKAARLDTPPAKER